MNFDGSCADGLNLGMASCSLQPVREGSYHIKNKTLRSMRDYYRTYSVDVSRMKVRSITKKFQAWMCFHNVLKMD